MVLYQMKPPQKTMVRVCVASGCRSLSIGSHFISIVHNPKEESTRFCNGMTNFSMIE